MDVVVSVAVVVFCGVVAAALKVRHHRRRAAWRARAMADDARGSTLDAVCASLPSPGVGAAMLLPDNTAAWVARWRLLQNAKSSIDFSTFIIAGDAFGLALAGALLRKQEEGLRVRVIVDWFGLRRGSKVPLGLAPLRALRAAGADVRIYNVLSPRHLGILFRRRSFLPLFACDHEKVLMVDDRAAICGGRNVSSDYFAALGDDPKCFTDRDVLLDGDSLKGLRCGFEHEHRSVASRRLRRRAQDPAVRATLLRAAAAMDHWLTAPAFAADDVEAPQSEEQKQALARSIYDVCGGADDESFRNFVERLVQQRRLRGAMQVQLPKAHVADLRVLMAPSCVEEDDGRLNRALLQLLAAAKESVLIESPYLMLAERALIALEAAAARGVKVTLLTNGPTSTDNYGAQAFFLHTWPRILARVPTLRVFVHTGEHNAHGKTAVIDGKVALVGSYNLDIVSAAINGELAVVLRGPGAVTAVAAPILQKLATGAPHLVEYRIDKTALLTAGEVKEAYGPDDHVSVYRRVWMRVLARISAILSWMPGIAKP